MDHQQSIPTETVDQLLSLLANSRCRDAITCMRAESAEVFFISDLVSELGTRSDGNQTGSQSNCITRFSPGSPTPML